MRLLAVITCAAPIRHRHLHKPQQQMGLLLKSDLLVYAYHLFLIAILMGVIYLIHHLSFQSQIQDAHLLQEYYDFLFV